MKKEGAKNTPFVALVDNSTATTPNHATGRQHEVLSLRDPVTQQNRQYIHSQNRTGTNTTCTNSQICEVQNVAHSKSRDFSSFFVGSRVISNPSLHLVTPVDPLFFLLPYFEPTVSENPNQQDNAGTDVVVHKWQPWDQICSSKNIPLTVLDALKTRSSSSSTGVDGGAGTDVGTICSQPPQLGHLFAINDQYGDDMILHKFQNDKALSWLKKKMARVELFLRAQMILEKKKHEELLKKLRYEGGAFSSNFYHAESEEKDATITKTTEATAETVSKTSDSENGKDKEQKQVLTTNEKATLSKQAAQIICEYLSLYWQKEFLTYINFTEDVLYGNRKKNKSTTSKTNESLSTGVSNKGLTSSPPASKSGASATVTPPSSKGTKRSLYESNMSEADKLLQYTMGVGNSSSTDKNGKEKKKFTAKSVGLKRLEKVNTKGMKTMSSFFSVKKKLKKT